MLAGGGFACEPAADASRIAVAGGSLTEILYFLGAQDHIVGVESTANYPPEAVRHPSMGYVRALSAEGLLSLSPSLVLGEDDMGPPEVLAQIRRAGVDVVRIEAMQSAQGILAKVRCVAAVLGLQEAAEALIAARLAPQAAALAALAASASPSRPRVALLLGTSDGAPLVAGQGTSGDGLLRMIQAENVFGNVVGWKPMSAEAMAVVDPDFVLMAARGSAELEAAQSAALSPALRLTTAARAGRIAALDGMALLGFGPRTLSTALEIARTLQEPWPE